VHDTDIWAGRAAVDGEVALPTDASRFNPDSQTCRTCCGPTRGSVVPMAAPGWPTGRV
jgi:hypothetical protein